MTPMAYHNTSSIEAYDSNVIQFAPKYQHFMCQNMRAADCSSTLWCVVKCIENGDGHTASSQEQIPMTLFSHKVQEDIEHTHVAGKNAI